MFVCQSGRKEADVSVEKFEEGDSVEVHILSPKLFSLSPTSSPRRASVKTSPTHHGDGKGNLRRVPTTSRSNVCCSGFVSSSYYQEGLQDQGYFSVG